MSQSTRVFAARLAGLAVFDPLGDQVGVVRDVVVTFSSTRRKPLAVGLVVEVAGRRRVFVPLTRVTSMDAGQVITTGLVNMRRFEQRPAEVRVLAELLDRSVTVQELDGQAYPATVEDVAIERIRAREWSVEKLFVRKSTPAERQSRFRITRRRGETALVDVDRVIGLRGHEPDQRADLLLEDMDDLKAADLADVVRDLPHHRRIHVAQGLADDRLADLLEELPEDDQVQILAALEGERAADVLEEMQPDDAADLLSELSPEAQERYLRLMEPDEAEDIRRLLTYDENSAGGLMTTEPVILPPEATIAEALATVRKAELSPALAAMVYVSRAPTETPTGRFLGIVHIQRLLREPPHEAIGTVLDKDVEPLSPTDTVQRVTRELATYNLVSLPVTDEDGHLLGAVTVDDVLDHLLPEDWREDRGEETHG